MYDFNKRALNLIYYKIFNVRPQFSNQATRGWHKVTKRYSTSVNGVVKMKDEEELNENEKRNKNRYRNQGMPKYQVKYGDEKIE